MLHFDGAKEFAQLPAQVWQKLSDAQFLLACIQGVESVTTATKEKVVCTLRPGLAFMRGTLELTLTVTQATPDSLVELLLQTKGIGSSSEVQAILKIEAAGTGSQLKWAVEVKSLGGLLKAIPHGLIKAAAQKVIADALARVEQRLKG